jgi:hypothetical protein
MADARIAMMIRAKFRRMKHQAEAVHNPQASFQLVGVDRTGKELLAKS